MIRRVRLLVLLVVVASSATGVAYGYLTATSVRGASDPSAQARSLPAGSAPSASASATTVTVTIPQVSVAGQGLGTFTGGGYVVRRYAASATVDGTGAAPAGTCASVVSGGGASLTCDDTVVPSGSWKYTATPALNLWRGAESAAGAAVTVAAADTAPQLVSLEMRDANANGKVDQVRATFDETLAPSTATAPWTLANVPSGGTLASVATAGAVATLTLAEGAGAADTAVGGFTVALAASASGIRDAAGNQSSFAATAPADKAAPARTALEMLDVNENGAVDEVRATFSETLAPSTATAPWTLANVPGGGALSGVSTSGQVATLALAGGTANTAVGSFTVALAASPSGITDAAANEAAFAAQAPADKAKPVVTSLTLLNQNSGGAGQIQRNDQVVAVYSEALKTSTLVSTWTDSGDQSHGANANNEVTVTVANGAGGANDTLSVSAGTATVRFGTIDLGSAAWVSTNVTFRGNLSGGRSSLAWTAAARTLTITLGGASGTASAGAVVATLTPNSAVTDLANPANALTKPFATPSQVQF